MDLSKVEYRVREVTRYIVTRYHEQATPDGKQGCSDSRVIGQYDNADTAYAVGYAMCKNEHDNLGWPLGDGRIQYPSHPEQCAVGSREPFMTAGQVNADVAG